MNIGIIGSGISGSTVLRTLIKSNLFNQNSDSIHVFDKRPINGRGMAYQEDNLSLKLNTGENFLSVKLDERSDFSHFLNTNYPNWDDGEGLIPRIYFGNYLEDRFAEYYNHPLVHKHQENIVDVAVEKNTTNDFPYVYRLKNEAGKWFEETFDAVFFAIGHAPYSDYYDLGHSDKFIRDPYPMQESLNWITDDLRVGIIGSGATAFDLLRYFEDHYALHYPLTFYVRGNPFSSTGVRLDEGNAQMTIDDEWMAKQKALHGDKIPLNTILEQVEADFKNNAIDWHSLVREFGSGQLSENIRVHETQPQALAYLANYFEQITTFLPDLYQSITAEDKARFLLDYAPYVEHFRSPVPPGTMERIKQMLIQDRLRIVSGLSQIKTQSDGAFMVYTDDKFKETTDVLINATGFDNNLSHAGDKQPLITSLYNKEIIMPAYDGEDVVVTWPQTQVVNNKQGVLENAFFLGNYISHTQYANNNAQLMVKQAVRTADDFIEKVRGMNK